MEKFEWYTIEEVPNLPNEFVVYGHGTYEKSSVLAGAYKRCFLDSFSTIEDAQKAYPEAKESESTKYDADSAIQSFENGPEPTWFDPADAGEKW